MAVSGCARQGLLDRRACRTGVIATLIGALVGAGVLQLVDARFLEAAIPWLLGTIVRFAA